MRKATLAIFVLLIFAVGVLGVLVWDSAKFLIFPQDQSDQDAISSQTQDSVKESPSFPPSNFQKITPPSQNNSSNQTFSTSPNTDSNVGGGSGGSSGGGSSGGGTSPSTSPPSSQTCGLTQIPYGIKSFNTEERCITMQDSVCSEKEVTCSVLVQNLDPDTSGSFKIGFALYDSADSPKVNLDQGNQEKFLPSNTQETFEYPFTIAGEKANLPLSCDSYSLEIPKKEVCY